MGEQRRHLRVLVAVAVEELTAILVGGLADTEPRCGAGPSAGPPSATPVMAARSGRIGSKYGSGWTTRTSATPRHSRGVRSSVQTMIEMHEDGRARR